MKRKIFAIFICTLLITTIASFSATAIKCEKKPAKDLVKLNSRPDAPKVKIPEEVRQGGWLHIKTITSEGNNLLKDIQEAQGKISEYKKRV